MIQSFSSQIDSGELLELQIRGVSNYAPLMVINVEGLGAPDGRINSVESPNLHGSTVNSTKATQRFITMALLVQGVDVVGDQARKELYKFFPVAKKISFGVKTDTRDVTIDMWVESNPMKMFSKKENTEIKLVSENPWFRSVSKEVITFSGSIPLFEFPFSNESLVEPLIVFGEELSYISQDVVYDGDVETGVEIELFIAGDVSGTINLYNPAYGQSLEIDCSVLESILGGPLTIGDSIHISTVVGKKSLTLTRNGISYNALHSLNMHPDWITLYPGVNTIVYDATTGSDNLQFSMSYYSLYQGVV